MGRVNERGAPKTTKRFDSEKLARLSEQPVDAETEIVEVVAHGSEPTRLAAGTEPPIDLRSRTTTVHDPLTTGVLAEITKISDADENPPASPRLIKRR